jgi:hypothetical protein
VTGASSGSRAPWLFIGGNHELDGYTSPYSSKPSIVIPGRPYSITSDPTGTIFFSQGQLFNHQTLQIYRPPYAAPAASLRHGNFGAIIATSKNLFVASTDASRMPDIAVYAPPYSNASTPVALAYGNQEPVAYGFDRHANLFAYDRAGYIYEYAPPYSGNAVAKIDARDGGFADSMVVSSDGTLVFSGNSGTYVLRAPYSASPRQLTLDAGQLALGPNNAIFGVYEGSDSPFEYALTLSAYPYRKVRKLQYGVECAKQLAFDSARNLFIAQGCGSTNPPAHVWHSLFVPPPYTQKPRSIGHDVFANIMALAPAVDPIP